MDFIRLHIVETSKADSRLFPSVLQERLNKQQEDNDAERQRLQDLIARLETQIREQTRMLEDVSSVLILTLGK